jgi:hypothetical protein
VVDGAISRPQAIVYLPNTPGTVIVCATTDVNGGVHIEQPAVALVPWGATPDVLGRSVWEALLNFRRTPELNLRSYKRSDWPAYRASGAKSIRAFEEGFVRVCIEALPSVLLIKANADAMAEEGLFVGCHISQACEFEALTELINRVSRCSQQIARLEFS